VVARLPAEPARHRMAVWRELRRAGAVMVGQGSWALPDRPAVLPLLGRLGELTEAAEGGTLLVLRARGYRDLDDVRLRDVYRQARQQEWAEFLADCDKYLAELDREVSIGKFTLAELEEEEQSLDRLRRWYRELRGRDLSSGEGHVDGVAALKRCEERFDSYADQVYATLGGAAP
jgi:hypothetical protein